MSMVRIEHSFKFYSDPGHPIKHEAIPKDFLGNDDIPNSKWRLSCETVRDSTSEWKNWRFNVDFHQYAYFKDSNVTAVGQAHLKWDFGTSSDTNIVKDYNTCHSFNLELFPLKDLTSERVWSHENAILTDTNFTFSVNIILFCNKLPPPSLSKIQTDFADLFKNGAHTDIALVVDEKEFKVHKSILSSRSAVFQRMLEVDMREKFENKIVIEDVNSGVLEAMLMFMYSGSFEGNMEPGFLEDLFTASEKYELTDLKKVVLREMCSGITVDNIGRRFVLSDQFDEVFLRQKCLEFIRDNCTALSTQDKSILFA